MWTCWSLGDNERNMVNVRLSVSHSMPQSAINYVFRCASSVQPCVFSYQSGGLYLATLPFPPCPCVSQQEAHRHIVMRHTIAANRKRVTLLLHISRRLASTRTSPLD